MPAEKKFKQLLKVIEKLRSPKGCPWDKKQTHKSLKPYLIEEAYEVLAAIDKKDSELLKEELGDLLLQVVLHAQIAKEKKEFTMKDIVDVLKAKMVRRHPHVFKKLKVKNVNQVLVNWEKIKKSEGKNKNKSILEGIPEILPSLYRAEKVQKKAARVGFDWEEVDGAWGKVKEEIKEFHEAYNNKRRNKKHLEEELGDVLFSLVNVARKLNIHAEESLKKTIDKFVKRFNYIERVVENEKKDLLDYSLEELDGLWEESKKSRKSGSRKSKV